MGREIDVLDAVHQSKQPKPLTYEKMFSRIFSAMTTVVVKTEGVIKRITSLDAEGLEYEVVVCVQTAEGEEYTTYYLKLRKRMTMDNIWTKEFKKTNTNVYLKSN